MRNTASKLDALIFWMLATISVLMYIAGDHTDGLIVAGLAGMHTANVVRSNP